MAATQGHGNPNWNRDETILALELYLELNGKIPDTSDPRVQTLSTLLRSLPFHVQAARRPSFRNPDGVAFKLQNLRQVATGKGLSSISKTDTSVWSEFGNHPEAVKALAAKIRTAAETLDDLKSDNDLSEEFREGRLLTEMHKRRERSPKIRHALLKARRAKGTLQCDVCSCTATVLDAALEDAIFEAHHLIPISESGENKTKISDVALLCANCHRLVHRAIAREKRWLPMSEAKAILRLRGVP